MIAFNSQPCIQVSTNASVPHPSGLHRAQFMCTMSELTVAALGAGAVEPMHANSRPGWSTVEGGRTEDLD